jgi:hypothetical protein
MKWRAFVLTWINSQVFKASRVYLCREEAGRLIHIVLLAHSNYIQCTYYNEKIQIEILTSGFPVHFILYSLNRQLGMKESNGVHSRFGALTHRKTN